MTAIVQVAAGILLDDADKVLIAERLPGAAHGAGYWEFPGGKVEPGETALAALRRELAEELRIAIGPAEPFMQLSHRYPERHVAIDFWLIRRWDGDVRPCDGQRLAWVDLDGLERARLLPADAPVVTALRAWFGRAPADSSLTGQSG
ncbi:MAG: 8-oxo-dGTP diphosphatase MutT [Pseudomonadota bacterium]